MLAGTVGLAVDLTQRAAAVKPHIPGYESRGRSVFRKANRGGSPSPVDATQAYAPVRADHACLEAPKHVLPRTPPKEEMP
jgi:hypothetical protein